MVKKEINELVYKIFYYKQKIKKFEIKYNKLKDKLYKFFDECLSINKIELPGNDLTENTIVVSKRERVSITYFPLELKKRLEKKMFNRVVEKQYYVKDIKRFIEILKKANISPKEFKEIIEVDYKVKENAIKKELEVGNIKIDEIKDCLSAKITKYIDIREEKPKEG
jgi:hypothetical protein